VLTVFKEQVIVMKRGMASGYGLSSALSAVEGIVA
jgi:hypothetical protein